MPSNVIESYETFKKAYLNMLKNRNLITNTYKEDIAEEIYIWIKEEYIEELENFIKKFDEKIVKNKEE